MDINELVAKIDKANADTAAVMAQRNKNLGKKEALEKQLASLLEAYKAKYGVELTPDTLQEEINRVSTEKAAELSKTEQALTLIQSGRFNDASVLLTGEELKTVAQAEGVDAQEVELKHLDAPVEVANAVTASIPASTAAPVVNEAVIESKETAGAVAEMPSISVPDEFGIPSAPPAPSIPIGAGAEAKPFAAPPVAPPVAPVQGKAENVASKPAVFGAGDSPMSAMAGFTKPNQGRPVVPPTSVAEDDDEDEGVAPAPPPTSFGAIFGGTAFLNK